MPLEVIMPALGMTQDTGLIVSWFKQPGEAVQKGDALFEVETDKATMEIEAQSSGFLTDVRAAAGEAVPVGEIVAMISETAEDTGLPAKAANAVATAPVKQEPALEPEPQLSTPAQRRDGRILASPKARRLAHERGIELRWLVEQGIPQPYHAADLDKLTRPEFSRPAKLRARVDTSAVRQFLDWIAAEADTETKRVDLWAALAAKGLRSVPEYSDFTTIIVASSRLNEPGRLLVDPDRTGLLNTVEAPEGTVPVLNLLDLSGTPIIEISPGKPSEIPSLVLSSGTDGVSVDAALSFDEGELPLENAIRFLRDFEKNANAPLSALL